jgi:hypothetical protein
MPLSLWAAKKKKGVIITPRPFTPLAQSNRLTMATNPEFSNPLRKFKLVFLGEQSGKYP